MVSIGVSPKILEVYIRDVCRLDGLIDYTAMDSLDMAQVDIVDGCYRKFSEPIAHRN